MNIQSEAVGPTPVTRTTSPCRPVLVPPELPGSSPQLAAIARRCAMLVGDTALAWVPRAASGELTGSEPRPAALVPAACDGRDPVERRRLRQALAATEARTDDRWIDQVRDRLTSVRIAAMSWRDLGLSAPHRATGDVSLLCLPVLNAGQLQAVVAIIRGPGRLAFTLRDSLTAARAAAPDGASGEGGPELSRVAERAAICTTDLDGDVTYVSTAATELFGRPAGALHGQPLSALVDEVPEMLDGTFAVHAERCDRRLVTARGADSRWLDTISQPLLDDAGRRTGTLITFVDVSTRRAAEGRARARVPVRLRPRGGPQPLR